MIKNEKMVKFMDLGEGTNTGLTFLIDADGATLELKDYTSGITFFKSKITPEQLLKAMGRQGLVPIKGNLYNLENVGKRLVIASYTFEFRSHLKGESHEDYKEAACNVAERLLKDSIWTLDRYFGSQDSFFTVEGKVHAKATVRRYITL